MMPVSHLFHVALPLTLLCASCHGWGTPPTPVTNLPPEPAPAPVEESEPIQPATAFTQPIDVVELANAYNAFGVELFTRVASGAKSENVFISPLSVAFALAMTYNGAYADTASAMADVLQIGAANLAAFNTANLSLRTALGSDAADAILAIANSLWVADNMTFRPPFLDATRTAFDAELAQVDFLAPGTAERINAWVEKATRDKITNLVKKDDLTDETLAILINAVYFKGVWKDQFDKSRTQDKPFHLPDGTTVDHPLMWRHGSFVYIDTPAFQAVRLPYRGDALVMQVFLPAEDSNLDAFLKELTPANWNEWQRRYRMEDGTLMLPRFTSEYETEMKDVLTQLGMGIAFDRDAGDFRCMATCPERIVIDKVRHKSFVEVNEEGTEAAAATSVGMVRVTAAMPQEPFSMIVDRPFFYAITDTETGAIVFAGVMNDPR